MRKGSRLFVGIVIFIFMSVAYADAWNYRQHTKINWLDYNADAFLIAKNENKPLYIFIYSDLCSWCRKFETESLEKPAVRNILTNKFVPVALDQQIQPELAKQLGISLVPASLLITPDKKKLLRFYGFLTEAALTDALNKTLLSWQKGEIPEEEFSDESTCCPIPGGAP